MNDMKKAAVDTPPRSGQVLVLRWQYPGRTPQRRVFLQNPTVAQRRYERHVAQGATAALYAAPVGDWTPLA
jgi:hypothetical protein